MVLKSYKGKAPRHSLYVVYKTLTVQVDPKAVMVQSSCQGVCSNTGFKSGGNVNSPIIAIIITYAVIYLQNSFGQLRLRACC